MTRATLLVASVALLFAARSARGADPVADRVTALPGWSDAFRSARYSGFLRGSDATRHVSYFLAESEGDPANDPVVVWFNGAQRGARGARARASRVPHALTAGARTNHPRAPSSPRRRARLQLVHRPVA